VEFAVPYGNEMSPARRVASFAAYGIRAAWTGMRLPRPDVVFGSSTPLTVPAVAALVARWHGVPWVFEVRDLWPDFPVQMGAVRHPLARRALYALERRLYRSADHVLALSPDMTEHVQRLAPRTPTGTVFYGTDFDRLDAISDDAVRALRCRLGASHRRIVLYAGSLGRANAIPTLLDAARRLEDRGDVQFVFAGDGHHAPAIRDAARSSSAVRMLGPRTYDDTLALFRAADLSVVSFADVPVLASTSPSKFFDSLAAGTPVVVTTPGWTADLVARAGCGWGVPPEDPRALARRIAACLDTPTALARAGRRAEAVARRSFRREAAVDQIASVLASHTGTE
jgi:glycosyltransferase involved in cell wall biosynthesis